MNPIHIAPSKNELHTNSMWSFVQRNSQEDLMVEFFRMFLLFQKSFTHFGGTSCLINMEVGVLLKVVQTLTSMGYRFDMSISNRFCELVQDQTQPVHTVLCPQLSSSSTLGSNCRQYSILAVVVFVVCTKNIMTQNNCTITLLFM
jgi:hypothetical protein